MLINLFFSGVLAGLFATLPMTCVMGFLFQFLAAGEKYPLPPREITEELAEKLTPARFTERQTYWLTMCAHFAYGGFTGGLYGLTAGQLAGAFWLKSIPFGLLIWAGSYLGMLPMLKILTPATEHPGRRNMLMIGAHVVWGWALGFVFEAL